MLDLASAHSGGKPWVTPLSYIQTAKSCAQTHIHIDTHIHVRAISHAHAHAHMHTHTHVYVCTYAHENSPHVTDSTLFGHQGECRDRVRGIQMTGSCNLCDRVRDFSLYMKNYTHMYTYVHMRTKTVRLLQTVHCLSVICALFSCAYVHTYTCDMTLSRHSPWCPNNTHTCIRMYIRARK